jgi:hypothetical protein
VQFVQKGNRLAMTARTATRKDNLCGSRQPCAVSGCSAIPRALSASPQNLRVEQKAGFLRTLGMLRAHRGLLKRPAIDHIEIEAPVRTDAKAQDLPMAQQSVNRSRMRTQMLRKLTTLRNPPVIQIYEAKKLQQIRGILGGSAHRLATFCGRGTKVWGGGQARS